MKIYLIALFTLISAQAFAADNLATNNHGVWTLTNNSNQVWFPQVCYTTDGNSNVIPISSSGGGGGGGSSSGVDGTGSASTSVAALASNTCKSVIFQNDPSSTTNIKVGYTTSPALIVIPGGSLTLSITNSNVLHFQAVSGTPTYNWGCGS